MNNTMPFIPKDDQRLPDYYGVTVYFHDEKTVDFDVASHAIKDGFLEIVTHDDEWNIIPMTSIRRLKFDKEFSKVIAIRDGLIKKETKVGTKG